MIIAIMFFTILGGGQPRVYANGAYDGEFDIEAGTGTGSGWTFASPTLTITAPGNYRIYGTGTETNNRIVVNPNISATVMVENVNISTSGCAMDILAGTGIVDLVLKDGTSNVFISQVSGGANPGIQIRQNATLRISAETGDTTADLEVWGAGSDCYAAGLGGPTYGAGGNLVINSGIVEVYGDYTGQTGAVIGCGGGGSFGDITINGGIVSAIPTDVSTFGIGCNCGDITINGGSVSTGWTSYVAAMYTGNNIAINGGSVYLRSNYSTAMAVGSGSSVTVNGGILDVAKNWVWGTAIDTSTGNLIVNGGEIAANGGVSGQTLILDSGSISVVNGDINMPVTTTGGTPTTEGGKVKLYPSTYSVNINGVVTGDFELDLNGNLPGFITPVITSSRSDDGSFVISDGSFDLDKTSDASKSYWRLRASTDATLSGLSLSSGTLTPAFDGGTSAYTASVPYSTGSITVTPTTNNSNATVEVNGLPVSSGSPSEPISLNVGTNTINVDVTAQDGTTTQTYTLDVTRNEAPSTDATLSGLSLSFGTLTPAFAQGTFAYSASVPYGTSSITVAPTTNNGSAAVKVNDVTVASGNPSGPISLNVGSNTINVVVTAQDGATTETYTVIVTRDTAAPTDCIVTFDPNGGSAVASVTASCGTKINEPAPPPTKSGYIFAGWYTDDNTFENIFDFANTAITADITLHAKWTAKHTDDESRDEQRDHDKTQCGTGERCIAYPGLLKVGSSGRAVKELQQELNKEGYVLAVDGIFGPKTKAAVIKFQSSQIIAVDGIVGPVTWGKLFGCSCKEYSRTSLMQGSAGTAVKELQQALNQKGYILAVDGIFGQKTKTAVLSFQRNEGIAADGIVGDITWGRLFSSQDKDICLIMY